MDTIGVLEINVIIKKLGKFIIGMECFGKTAMTFQKTALKKLMKSKLFEYLE